MPSLLYLDHRLHSGDLMLLQPVAVGLFFGLFPNLNRCFQWFYKTPSLAVITPPIYPYKYKIGRDSVPWI
jgi:hypothetical protein